MRFAVDTGGTFTDLVVADTEGRLHFYKTPTTAKDRVEGVLASFRLASDDLDLSLAELLGRGELLVHGTTTATNAIVTGETAKTAFLTTAGHPDILVFREGGRMGAPMFDYSIPYPKPYVPRALTFEVPERIGADGKVVVPLDEESVRAVIGRLRELEVRAVAVCFLWSIVNYAHERRVGELIQEALPGVQVTLSHALNPTLREYRRASSACIDASLKPLMGRYLRGLETRLRDGGYRGRVLVVTSQGTVRDARELASAPIHTVKSGPAMSPVAGRRYARADFGAHTAIVIDVGGTTSDVSLIRRGRISETRETWLGPPFLGHMTGFPSIDVRSVGAGGGSIASVDEAGLLRVGPESAGAHPGPACYGRGGARPTLTDACLVLGIIDRDNFLDGRITLSADAAQVAIEEHVGRKLELDATAAAGAILAVATETMALAIEDITVRQGMDPSTAVLVGGGGAAGLNAVSLARRIGCPTVLIPHTGAALSAAGALLSPIGQDFAEVHVTDRRSFDVGGVNAVLERLRAACEDFVRRIGATAPFASIEYAVEARYVNQVWEIKLPVAVERFDSEDEVERLHGDFHALHRETFAVDDERANIEFITWQARVSCPPEGSSAEWVARTEARTGAPTRRNVHFPDAGAMEACILAADQILPGHRIPGPAIVEFPFTTIVIDPGSTAQRSKSGGLRIRVGPSVG